MKNKKYFKGYYMMTAKCNLACTYCVLENSKSQLKQELSLVEKKKLISHLYHNFNFRQLTLSGGEALIIGKNVPSDFLSLLDFFKEFKSENPEDNLVLHLYTNALILDAHMADCMVGIIDEISITIDSLKHETLLEIGRNRKADDNYLANSIKVIKLLSDRGIDVKLHTVVSKKNQNSIGKEALKIYQNLIGADSRIKAWKFYQYMSYDAQEIDSIHSISDSEFKYICAQINHALKGFDLKIHFKDNQEMNESIFNILAYGNAQFMNEADTWTSSKRTDFLCNYPDLKAIFDTTSLSESKFEKYHLLKSLEQ